MKRRPATPRSPSDAPALGGAAAPRRFVDGYLGYLLGQANHALYKEFDAHVRAAGLSSIEWRVLATLHDSEPLTVSRLAHEVLSKQPTVTKLARRMADQGWLRLEADPADQRRTLVAATPGGRRLVQPLVERARQQEAELLRMLSARDKAALKRLLASLALARPSSKQSAYPA
ncbi:MAG TPA: MarR family transcriptional regulator [Ramlibacter sp.]|uniref:MarR family winged helix-turn-helix transcriptional regulator n=1 Tax=Ramlibacter sp. TaxID=1917967 RepID=UPI002BD17F25|nr:MarR family transcriptional regulator [Ramlibacter sp.]HVZ42562.1 MarR family transcriptional regulator [Ramlibacter sp.]